MQRIWQINTRKCENANALLEIDAFNSTYFSRSTPSFVWKILFLAQIFYTAS
jgi:hypothetical protein